MVNQIKRVMKELSIEEKAKRYDEILARAKGANLPYYKEDIMSKVKEFVDYLLPELKESEDNRIKKALIKLVKKAGEGYENVIDGVSIENAISWLEKQGDKVTRNEDGVLVNLSQLKRVAKPADKSEPKFKVGDWVVFNNKHQSIYRVEKIEDGYYILRHTHGGTFRVCVLHDESLRLWTNQDAKDGDVLAVTMYPEGTWIGIFKENNGCTFSSYCFVNTEGTFKLGTYNHGNGKAIHPATKEQRDLLFQKMKEAGYDWDADKKELKKIEQKPAWNEEDKRIIDNLASQLCNLYARKLIKEETKDKYVDWLKSIKDRVQPKQGWSEEDSRILYNVKAYIGYAAGQQGVKDELFKEANKWLNSLPIGFIYNKNYNEDMVTLLVGELKQISNNNNAPEQYKVEINWLKSLRPQNTWKPSDEQMVALDDFIYAKYPNIEKHGAAVKSLYQDLKKLREE